MAPIIKKRAQSHENGARGCTNYFSMCHVSRTDGRSNEITSTYGLVKQVYKSHSHSRLCSVIAIAIVTPLGKKCVSIETLEIGMFVMNLVKF